MPSPARLFRFLTTAELATVRAAAVAGIISGQYTSTSGAGKSGSKQRLDLETQLRELNAEYQARGVCLPRVSTVYQNFVRRCGCCGPCGCGASVVTFDSSQVTFDSTSVTWDS